MKPLDNEYFSLQHYLYQIGKIDVLTEVWACLDHIRTRDIHPAECGFTLDQIQLASEWNNQFTPDYSYLQKFILENK